MSSSAPPPKICFNPECRETKSDHWRSGWRLRAGGRADLCERCGLAYSELRFCENFHTEASGWRNCESCGKGLHCGCIASEYAFILLDVGGVECNACAAKKARAASNQIWPSSLLSPLSGRLKDISSKSWNQTSGSCSIPGHWWQGQNPWNSANNQSELHSRVPFEVERPNGLDSIKDHSERITSGGIRFPIPDRLANDNTLVDSLASLNILPKESINDDFQDDGPHRGEGDPRDIRKGVPFSSSPNETNDPTSVSGAMSQRQTPPSPLAKQFLANSHSGMDTSAEIQMRNARPRGEAQKRSQVLPRYWPRISDQELQQMSGDSNSVITPLFEKMLSASDAGRIGRLVLPKKCAEAYFPHISQPEGLPLKVQDAKGKDWVFQFRFWPNNNSRMYVLEGVTPCIHSMQLQAGDTVTFSRIDPEGKLVMGFRKASAVASEQDAQVYKAGNGTHTNGEVSNKTTKTGELPSTAAVCPNKGGAEPMSNSSINHVSPTDPVRSLSKLEKGGSKEGSGAKSSLTKKKNSLGSKNKRLRITVDDPLDLKLTWEQAQELLRPPPNHLPSIVVIEGHEFEEYEEAPILGKPCISTTNQEGERHLWAQCEDCSKWRKLPADTVLPSRWTCSDNLWDPKRSSCSSAQEMTTEEFEDMLPPKKASKRTRARVELDAVEASEGLDTLANLAILGEGEPGDANASNQPTTRHPRHRPGCSCIVCIQPPSGKGPKHKQTCTCNVCLTVKRRFHTLMLRRERRQFEKDAETARKKHSLQSPKMPELEAEEGASNKFEHDNLNSKNMASEGVSDDPDRRRLLSSPFKGHIDLNIQPEREDEPSSLSDTGCTVPNRDIPEIYLEQQLANGNPFSNREPRVNHIEIIGNSEGQRHDVGAHDNAQMDNSLDSLVSLALPITAATTGTG